MQLPVHFTAVYRNYLVLIHGYTYTTKGCRRPWYIGIPYTVLRYNH